MEPIVKKCLQCKKIILFQRSGKRFCSSACRNKAWTLDHPRVAIKRVDNGKKPWHTKGKS